TSQANPDQVFGDVFEDLLRSEVDNPSWFYAPIGAITGACLGFICGNVPGLVMGAYTGHKLGSVRDAKGILIKVFIFCLNKRWLNNYLNFCRYVCLRCIFET